MHDAVANGQRGRDEPVSFRRYRRILAQVQRQFGENGALDFLEIVILGCGSGTPRKIAAISLVRRPWLELASKPWPIHALASCAAAGA